ncbi:hypothetical protein DKY63_20100 [Pseudomonas putida]|uniref:Uncharacterized protein n=1 Tax=Pseudomonas putida TaxID=303 RepID=A0A2Z4RLU7_PSEPU|nr:hypothetical protein [Pseudomonas putida]AWY42083.1 hypothetical protein DKY63_20100 [Pseudomonas putida]
MSIETKDWTAQIDRMPGNQSFRVHGTVTVAHTGVAPRLEHMKLQDKSFNIRLELKLETSNEASLQVVTEKPVEFKVMGNSNVTGVSIYHEGKLLHKIDNIMITD